MNVIQAHTELLKIVLDNYTGDDLRIAVINIVNETIAACVLRCHEDQVAPEAFERIKEGIFSCN